MLKDGSTFGEWYVAGGRAGMSLNEYLARDMLFFVPADKIGEFLSYAQSGLTFTIAEVGGKTSLFSLFGDLGKFYTASDGGYLNENPAAAVFPVPLRLHTQLHKNCNKKRI